MHSQSKLDHQSTWTRWARIIERWQMLVITVSCAASLMLAANRLFHQPGTFVAVIRLLDVSYSRAEWESPLLSLARPDPSRIPQIIETAEFRQALLLDESMAKSVKIEATQSAHDTVVTLRTSAPTAELALLVADRAGKHLVALRLKEQEALFYRRRHDASLFNSSRSSTGAEWDEAIHVLRSEYRVHGDRRILQSARLIHVRP
jgi:hypothetical protein